MKRAFVTSLAVSAAVIACSTADVGPRRPAAPAPEPVAAAPKAGALPFDVAAILRKAHFAFEAVGDAFEGGDRGYVSRVDAAGVLRVRPQRAPRADVVRAARGPVRRVLGAELALETASIARRGGEALAMARVASSAEGGLRIARGGVEERLANTPGGVEQSFHFAARPAGEGDLVVRLRARGLRYAGATREGLAFADPASGMGVRYGRATWVDARGARVAVVPRFEGGEVVLRVPASVVEAAAFPAVLDPLVAPEVRVGAVEVGPGDAVSNATAHRAPAVATDGTGFLVVWEDDRTGDSRIRAARLDGAGNVLSTPAAAAPADYSGFVVSDAASPRGHFAPSVAWNGSAYVVAWAAVTSTDSDVEAVLVPPTGDMTGQTPFAVTAVAGSMQGAYRVDVACAGATDGCLVVWDDDRQTGGDLSVFGARVSAAGAVTPAAATGGVRLTDEGGGAQQVEPALATRGTEYMLVYSAYPFGSQTPSLGWTSVSLAGAAADVAGQGHLPPPSPGVGYYSPGIAAAPVTALPTAAYVLVAEAGATTEPRSNAVTAAYVTAAGAIAAPVANVSVSATNSVRHARVAFDGTNALVAWDAWTSTTTPADEDRYDVVGRHVTATSGGAVSVVDADDVDLAPQATEGEQRVAGPPAIVGAGAGVALVAWGDHQYDVNGNDQRDVTAARVGAAGLLGRAFPVSVSANRQREPRAAWSPAANAFLLAWSDLRSSPSRYSDDVLAQRLAAAGPVGATVVVAAAPDQGELSPDVAWDGNAWVVAYEHAFDVEARRVNASGGVGTAITVAATTDDELAPAVAGGASGRATIAWTRDVDPVTGNTDVYATQIDAAGALVGTPFELSSATGAQRAVRLAYDGDRSVLAVWETNLPAGLDVRGAVIDEPTRAVGGSASTDRIAISAGAWDEGRPVVAAGNGAFVVAWLDGRNGGGNGTSDVYAVRVVGGAVQTDVTALTVAGDDHASPAIAFDGTRFFAVWRAIDINTGVGRLSGAFAAASGTSALLVPQAQAGGFRIDAALTEALQPTVASSPAGLSLVAYTRYDDALRTFRVRARFVAGLGQACTDAAVDCMPGASCVDGVCCDTACGGGGADCTACSTAAGAAVNGICGARSDGATCGGGGGTCSAAVCLGPDGGVVDAGSGGTGDAGADGAVEAGGGDAGPDAGDDAAVGDASTGDAAIGDASTDDAAIGDASTGDAAIGDASAGDAAAGDASAGDASTADSGGSPGSAGGAAGGAGGGPGGTLDASAARDAAADAGTDGATDSGCGCRTAGSGPAGPHGLALALVGALAFVVRRRRAR